MENQVVCWTMEWVELVMAAATTNQVLCTNLYALCVRQKDEYQSTLERLGTLDIPEVCYMLLQLEITSQSSQPLQNT